VGLSCAAGMGVCQRVQIPSPVIDQEHVIGLDYMPRTCASTMPAVAG
jgi:hypothetical protein